MKQRVELQRLGDGFYLRDANMGNRQTPIWLAKSDGWTIALAERCREIVETVEPEFMCECDCQCTGCSGDGCDCEG